jgi:hypothetical protein
MWIVEGVGLSCCLESVISVVVESVPCYDSMNVHLKILECCSDLVSDTKRSGRLFGARWMRRKCFKTDRDHVSILLLSEWGMRWYLFCLLQSKWFHSLTSCKAVDMVYNVCRMVGLSLYDAWWWSTMVETENEKGWRYDKCEKEWDCVYLNSLSFVFL